MAEVYETTLEDLIPDDINANRGTARGGGELQNSLQQYGAGRSILIDRNGKIIAGNKTFETLGQIGMEDVIVVETDGTKIVAVKRIDLDMDTDPERARGLALADNRVAELSLDWDPAAILQLQELGVNFEGLFSDAELTTLLATLDVEEEEEDGLPPGVDPDELPSDVETRCREGDIWILGKHRLMCGDATVPSDVDRLFAGGHADLLFTDPPYGVKYAGKTEERLTISGDDKGFEGTRALVRDILTIAPLKAGGTFYICSPSGAMETAFRLALIDTEWPLRQCIAWVKNHFVLSAQDYHWRHESILAGTRPDPEAAPAGEPITSILQHGSILYGWKTGAAHYFVNDRKQDTVWEFQCPACHGHEPDVWEFDRPARNAEHPTMKPVALVEKAIQNSSVRGQVVYDACGGSGSTLIACEATGRVCRIMEKSPRYADVIIARYEALTGKSARREEGTNGWI